jgi:hypothetical protein
VVELTISYCSYFTAADLPTLEVFSRGMNNWRLILKHFVSPNLTMLNKFMNLLEKFPIIWGGGGVHELNFSKMFAYRGPWVAGHWCRAQMSAFAVHARIRHASVGLDTT